MSSRGFQIYFLMPNPRFDICIDIYKYICVCGHSDTLTVTHSISLLIYFCN